jgi:hypothetical protein
MFLARIKGSPQILDSLTKMVFLRNVTKLSFLFLAKLKRFLNFRVHDTKSFIWWKLSFSCRCCVFLCIHFVLVEWLKMSLVGGVLFFFANFVM